MFHTTAWQGCSLLSSQNPKANQNPNVDLAPSGRVSRFGLDRSRSDVCCCHGPKVSKKAVTTHMNGGEVISGKCDIAAHWI